MFPRYLMHYTTPNTDDVTRRVVAEQRQYERPHMHSSALPLAFTQRHSCITCFARSSICIPSVNGRLLMTRRC